MLAQQRADAHVGGAADAVRGDGLALQVLDGPDRALLQNEVLAGVMALDAVLETVRDDAEIVHVPVQHRSAKRREGERGDVEIAGRERRDFRRGRAEMNGLDHIGIAVMAQDGFVREQDRRHGRGCHDPARAHRQRLGCRCPNCAERHESCGENSERAAW